MLAKAAPPPHILTISSGCTQAVKGVGRRPDVDRYAVEISKAAVQVKTAFFRQSSVSLTLVIVVIAAVIGTACTVCGRIAPQRITTL